MKASKNMVATIYVFIVLCTAALYSTVYAATIWPEGSVVLLPGIPVAHTDNGLKLLDTEVFIDGAGRTQVPLRFIAEELGATVDYFSPTITIRYLDLIVRLELEKPIAIVNEVTVEMDTAPLLQNNRTFVPLRFVAENLGFPVRYNDGVIVVGSWYADITAEEASTWRNGIMSHWVSIEDDWKLTPVVTHAPLHDVYPPPYAWRPLGDYIFALYKLAAIYPDKALLIADDLEYQNDTYTDGRTVVSFAFLEKPDAVYAVLHTGGATMGGETLYRFSTDTGAVLLASGRLSGNIAVEGEYVYYTESYPFEANTTMRVNISKAMKGEQQLERIGKDGFYYGYVIIADEEGRSGGETGFFVNGDFFYANAFFFRDGEENPLASDMAFYCVNLSSMEHELLAPILAINPVLYRDWIILYYSDGLYTIPLDGGEHALLWQGTTESFYVSEGRLYYAIGYGMEEGYLWDSFALDEAISSSRND